MLLEKIHVPSDIKKLSPVELTVLAKEVRKRIVNVVSQTGGHIAPSLGTVDLTIALLSVFDPDMDSIVWDVGHQSYAWKILTGRNDRFDTLRTLSGISGFTNRDESRYDAFGTGHSSTSVSAALGIACGRDLTKERGFSVAVIGDGALTGGMSFEALNHAGHIQPDKFIVVLNDNAMSISKNVGGLQKYMARMLVSRSYNSLKKQIWDKSQNLPPNIRKHFIYGARKLEESMMNILVPNIIFEDLGFKYVGPIDGHNIEHLTAILNRVKNYMVGPVLVHIVTKKGKGYAPAEQNAASYHGVGPFEPESGKIICSGKESWSEVFGKHLTRIATKDPRIVAISAAMSAGTGLSFFESVYPNRFFDVGIAEQHAVTLAAGMATKGIKPFVAIYSTFFQRALDQIIHDVALQRLPVVFCIDRAGLVGEDGATHHGAFDVSFLNYIPNMTIFAPSDANQLTAVMDLAAAWQEGPIAIRYPRGTAPCAEKPQQPVTIGKSVTLAEGSRVAIISAGDALPIAQELHSLLGETGFAPMLVDLLCLKPLDEALLDKLANSFEHVVTLETNSLIGGIGAEISRRLALSPAKVHTFGYPDHFVPHGKISELNTLIGFTAPDIFKVLSERFQSK